VGVLLPGVPVTPFLILAATLFSKGSDRIRHWLTNTAIYQKYLADFVQTKSMSRSAKCWILFIATSMLIVPFIMTHSVVVRICIAAALLIKYICFIFVIKTRM